MGFWDELWETLKEMAERNVKEHTKRVERVQKNRQRLVAEAYKLRHVSDEQLRQKDSQAARFILKKREELAAKKLAAKKREELAAKKPAAKKPVAKKPVARKPASK